MIVLLQTGFKLEETITVHGISSEALKITCQEAICWGNSFKSLSCLIMPDSQTGKLQQDGLIFKVHTILSHHNAHCLFFFNYMRYNYRQCAPISKNCSFTIARHCKGFLININFTDC